MTKKKTVLVTGANGDIGHAICSAFMNKGWHVIATDMFKDSDVSCDYYLPIDLEQMCNDESYHVLIIDRLKRTLPNNELHALVNNAAVQVVSPVEDLTLKLWRETLDVNLLAPFVLVKAFLKELTDSVGSVVNISSVHAALTKPNFVAYSSSKAALSGLTKSLSVELGDRIRVNAISPAAVSTSMLVSGFNNSLDDVDELEKYHPSKCIGKPSEVAKIALFLASFEGRFINGSIIDLDGGVLSRLHDPS